MISISGIPLTKMAKYAQKACIKDLEKWADSKFEQVKAFSSDWKNLEYEKTFRDRGSGFVVMQCSNC